jgi:hypothetical protein
MLTVNWVKRNDGNGWLPLEAVNLKGVTSQGVYIIWHGGNPAQVVRIGQGDIASRLTSHRRDPKVLSYKRNGPLMVTWARVSAAQQDGVERYLADRWTPLLGDAFPDVHAIAVNDPW